MLLLRSLSFRSTQTLRSDCALTILDITKRVFPSNRKRNREKNGRGTFFDFVTWSAEEPDKVENYRFRKNCPMDFHENQGAWSLFYTLSAENIKSAKIKILKIDFLKILPICTCKVEKNPRIFTPDFEVFYNWR